MAKLRMCRICLFANVHMYVVANKNLQETYAKLTDVPFVSEDTRPMLACSFCYTKLKQCCQLQKKCLEAEELFAQMLNNCEPKPLPNLSHMGCSSGFVRTAIEILSIVDDGLTEDDGTELELPAASERQHNVLKIKVERNSDDFESENNCAEENRSLYEESIPPHHTASDSEDDVPLVEIKMEVEAVKVEIEDLSKNQRGDKDNEIMAPEYSSLPGLIHIPPRPHSEDIVPLTKVETEVEELIENDQELSKEEPSPKKTRRTPVIKKSKVKDDTSTGKKKKNGRSKSKSYYTTQIPTSASLTKPKDPKLNTKLIQTGTDSVFNLSGFINNAIDTNFGKESDGRKILNSQSKSDELNTANVKENSFKCDVCERSFTDKGNLRRHVVGHGEAPLKCNVCERGFHAKSHLAKHQRTHTGERPFECDKCHRRFSERSNLIKHLRRHTGDKPYKCGVCQRTFNQKYHLQSHNLVHTGEKPFKCDVCQQGFNRLYNFKQHYRTHTGEKPHECVICRKSFTHKTSLTNHMRNHTGEKPFNCFVCQRNFTHKQSLDMHFRKHTGEKPYKCNVCQKCFTQGSHLKQHLARNHIGDKP